MALRKTARGKYLKVLLPRMITESVLVNEDGRDVETKRVQYIISFEEYPSEQIRREGFQDEFGHPVPGGITIDYMPDTEVDFQGTAIEKEVHRGYLGLIQNGYSIEDGWESC